MEQQVISVHYQRMEEWLCDRKAVLGKKHKNEYARLMELAPKLEHMVRYEIPAQCRQQKKISTALDDTYTAIEDSIKMKQTLEERQNHLLQEYGLIQGEGAEDVDLEMIVDARISTSITLLNEALRNFGKSTHLEAFRESYNRIASLYSLGMYDSDVFSLHFPWLERVYEERFCSLKGELRHDDDSDNKEHQQRVEDRWESQANMEPCNIDWGDLDATDSINIGAAVEIKWNGELLDVPVECTENGAYGSDGNNNNNNNGSSIGDEWEGNKLTDKVAGVFSVDLSNATHRQNIWTELQALVCFASERSSMDDDSLVETAKVVTSLLEKLTTSVDAALIRMKAIPTLRFSFMEEVRRFQRGIAATSMRQRKNEVRLQQLREELEQVGPQLDALLTAARTCRDECLAELMKMFPGRTVTIVGDINKYL